MSAKGNVLITGVSSGIGQATAQLLDQRGFTVFGTSRNRDGVATPGVHMLPLDVCLNQSVEACVSAVLKESGRLDILINNAGYAFIGAIEEAALEEAKSQFETNFFGVMRMVKAVLPIMRKQGSGQIINVSSLVGIAPLPFAGYYSASKFALEGFTEALRHEVKPFNIKVSLVEPAFIKTNFMRNRELAVNHISDYDPWRKRVSDTVGQREADGAEPTLVAECIGHIVESKSPGLRYPIGKGAARVVRMRRFFPESLFEKGIRRSFRLDSA